MTDDARLDAMVRGALAELPVPDEVQTRVALSAVLDRTTPRGFVRRPAPWPAAALAAAAVVLAVALTTFFLQRPDPNPSPAPAPIGGVVGTWHREVTGAAVRGWNGSWLMTLSPDGVLTLSGPAAAVGSSDGASYHVAGGQLRSDAFVNSTCPELPAGVYAVHVTSTSLSLSLVTDACTERVQLFAGQWQPAP